MVSAPSDCMVLSSVFQQFIGAYLPSRFYRHILSIAFIDCRLPYRSPAQMISQIQATNFVATLFHVIPIKFLVDIIGLLIVAGEDDFHTVIGILVQPLAHCIYCDLCGFLQRITINSG